MYLEEAQEALALIHRSIREINAEDYSPRQVEKIVRAYHHSVLKSGLVIVAEYRSQIVGVAKASYQFFRIQLIEAVFTHPDFVGKGIGKALVAELERLAKLRSVKKVSVYASTTAVGFYQSLGYESLWKGRILEEVNCVFMEKLLKHNTLFDYLSALLFFLLMSAFVFAILYSLSYLAYYLLIHGI